jgi:DNA polymerase-3 subunit alpha|tara:strand:+ start:7819 stop:8574 length:756 start_codon:yes stop_codon:yes gene_type:complete
MIPLFKSQYSLGRSILTLEAPDSVLESGPRSIIELALENELKEVYLADDSLSGFLQAYKNLIENDIKLIFGLRITICSDMNERSEHERKKSSKYIIFCKNTNGYKRLIKIATKAAREGFYYEPRTDFKTLKTQWDDEDLILCIPFYDSFLHRNTLENTVCVPEFTFTKPTLFLEDNAVPFDDLLRDRVEAYAEMNSLNTQDIKSIFYANREDFKAYLTFRCINNRSTLSKPNLDHMCSDEFCLESWKEKNA